GHALLGRAPADGAALTSPGARHGGHAAQLRDRGGQQPAPPARAGRRPGHVTLAPRGGRAHPGCCASSAPTSLERRNPMRSGPARPALPLVALAAIALTSACGGAASEASD